MVNVPTMEDFLALQKQVEHLQQQVQYLLGNELVSLNVKQTMQALKYSCTTLHHLKHNNKLVPHYEGSKPMYDCTSSAKSGQMRVKREESLLATLNALKNMTTAVGRFSGV